MEYFDMILHEMMRYKMNDFLVLDKEKISEKINLIGGCMVGGDKDKDKDKEYVQVSNFWAKKKDVIIVGAGPVGLWSAILLLKFNRARNVYILEKRLDKEMWNKRKYIVKINNGYLLQIDDLFKELNKNKKSSDNKKDDYSIKKMSFEKILKNYTDQNPYVNEYSELNPNPKELEYDQDFYAISNFQDMLKTYLEENYNERIKFLGFSDNMINYEKQQNKLNLNLAEINNLCSNSDEELEIEKIIDCTGIMSFIMNKILGIKFNEKKATNYGVGIKINWNKTRVLEIYNKQSLLLKKIQLDNKKYMHYTINKGNISNIEFEDAHIPGNILNAKVLFAECFRGQAKLLTDANYTINKKARKSYLPFKKSTLDIDFVGELLLDKEKYKDEIGYFQRDALRLFWKECVDIYNDDKVNPELKSNILFFFTEMKKSGMLGINAYDCIMYLKKIKTSGSLAIICYILNHLFYCRFIPQINKGEDIIHAKNIYIIDEHGKNIKNMILNDEYINPSKIDNIQKLFIEALREIQVTFIPERVEQILTDNLVNIDTVQTNIYQLKIEKEKDNKVNDVCKNYVSKDVKVFAIGDALFTTDFSLGMGVNRGLSTALQIIRDGISPQRIKNEINKYVHPKKLPKNTDWKLLYNLNSNYYFYIESVLPHNMIQKNIKKNIIYKSRKERLRWRKKYMKYIISYIMDKI